ncbi:hypothetical protein DSO57_1001483 [Entomophthora muscae]|uniref:Uncharacterized protein n=1 Tax=Entomophthora muscae TaxID=34485 RepID=A0ACC2UVX2_9FUNG|nr:hypothetical protein DSO57_1001483 [Entomophthora muscae]
MPGLLPSQSGGATEIKLESSRTPGHGQKISLLANQMNLLESCDFFPVINFLKLTIKLFLSNLAVAFKTYITGLSGLTIFPLWKPGPGSRNQTLTLDPWAASPVDRRTSHPHFSGINPSQADTKNVGPCNETGQTKEIIAPNGRLITAPNGGTEAATISFMILKSTPVINQEPSQERGTGLRPNSMTMTLKQDNQIAKLRFLTNERTPRLSAILLSLDPSTQFPWACLSQ